MLAILALYSRVPVERSFKPFAFGHLQLVELAGEKVRAFHRLELKEHGKEEREVGSEGGRGRGEFDRGEVGEGARE